jgi:hypothetical protein
MDSPHTLTRCHWLIGRACRLLKARDSNHGTRHARPTSTCHSCVNGVVGGPTTNL